jgi:hypothetical protein
MQRCDNSNSGEDSDDNSESSDDEENTSIRFNGRDGSDNGSGTQVYSDFFFGLVDYSKSIIVVWSSRQLQLKT